MHFSTIYQTLLLSFLFGSVASYGQAYTNKLEESSEILGETAVAGYSCSFDFSREKVRRGWWEYSRKFGSPINMKAYYKVKIPSDYTDGNTDLMLYSLTEESGKGATFFLGVAEEGYKDQIKNLIQDFKRNFYINSLSDEVATKEKEATRLAEAYYETALEDERDEILEKILETEKKVENLKEEIKKIVDY